jgi:hypothetical protein
LDIISWSLFFTWICPKTSFYKHFWLFEQIKIMILIHPHLNKVKEKINDSNRELKDNIALIAFWHRDGDK